MCLPRTSSILLSKSEGSEKIYKGNGHVRGFSIEGGIKPYVHYGLVDGKITKKMSILNCRVYILGTSGKNYTEAHNFKVSLDEKTKSNLKLLKETIL